jgi:hypothetical protein
MVDRTIAGTGRLHRTSLESRPHEIFGARDGPSSVARQPSRDRCQAVKPEPGIAGLMRGLLRRVTPAAVARYHSLSAVTVAPFSTVCGTRGEKATPARILSAYDWARQQSRRLRQLGDEVRSECLSRTACTAPVNQAVAGRDHHRIDDRCGGRHRRSNH